MTKYEATEEALGILRDYANKNNDGITMGEAALILTELGNRTAALNKLHTEHAALEKDNQSLKVGLAEVLQRASAYRSMAIEMAGELVVTELKDSVYRSVAILARVLEK